MLRLKEKARESLNRLNYVFAAVKTSRAETKNIFTWIYFSRNDFPTAADIHVQNKPLEMGPLADMDIIICILLFSESH